MRSCLMSKCVRRRFIIHRGSRLYRVHDENMESWKIEAFVLYMLIFPYSVLSMIPYV
jgi:hypothetical protein